MKTINNVIMNEVSRTCKCIACKGALLKGDSRYQVATPNQQRGVSLHIDCFENCHPWTNISTASNYASENCQEHTVTIRCHINDFGYFSQYGFKKANGNKNGFITVKATFNNAQSCGVTVAKAIEYGYTVKVNGDIVKSVAEYDTITKAICMR